MRTMEIDDIFRFFADHLPVEYEIRNTSHGEDDFREAIITQWENEPRFLQFQNRIVIKLAANDFTDEEHILLWERLTSEYRRMGYYCPEMIRAKGNQYPTVNYKGHTCLVYAEEFSRYKTADKFAPNITLRKGKFTYLDDVLKMNARIAAEHFDFSKLPSGYALFEPFSPADPVDEVMENAQNWQKYALKLPKRFQGQVSRIWERWSENREQLKSMYDRLPTSIFQADVNQTNILLDDGGHFAGVLDFNLAGRDTFLNYLFREIPYVFGRRENGKEEKQRSENEIAADRIFYAINVAKKYYHFSSVEKTLALPLYRCIRPLWYTNVERLREAKTEADIQCALDETERIQTQDIDFPTLMT